MLEPVSVRVGAESTSVSGHHHPSRSRTAPERQVPAGAACRDRPGAAVAGCHESSAATMDSPPQCSMSCETASIQPTFGKQQAAALLADPPHAGEVVAGVTAQCGEVEVVLSGHAVHGPQPRRVEQRRAVDAAADEPQHLRVVADVGEGVAVGGHDDAVPPVPPGPRGRRRAHVVGLEPRRLHGVQPERVEEGPAPLQLFHEQPVLRSPPRLVRRVALLPHRGAAVVESEDESVGREPVQSLQDLPQHAVQRPRRTPAPVAEAAVPTCVVVAVEQRRSIHGEQEASREWRGRGAGSHDGVSLRASGWTEV